MRLEVGKEYVSRNGRDKIEIVGVDRHSLHEERFIGSDSWSYRADGGFTYSGASSEWDLVISSTPQQDVLAEVFGERVRQDAKWGQQEHAPAVWISILGEEFGEVCRAVCEMHVPAVKRDPSKFAEWRDNYREELIQLAAVAVAMVECLDRNATTEETP